MRRSSPFIIAVWVATIAPSLVAGTVTFKEAEREPRSGLVVIGPERVAVWTALADPAKTGEDELDINRKTHKIRYEALPLDAVKAVDGVPLAIYQRMLKYDVFFRLRQYYDEQRFIFKVGVGWMGQIKVALVVFGGFFLLLPGLVYATSSGFKSTETTVAGAVVVSVVLTVLFLVLFAVHGAVVTKFEFFRSNTGSAVFTVGSLIIGLIAAMALLNFSVTEAAMSYLAWILGVPLILWIVSLVQPGLASLGGVAN